MAPLASRFTTTKGHARASASAARKQSDSPVIFVASASLGRNTSTRGKSSKTPSQRSGSQLVSRETVTPHCLQLTSQLFEKERRGFNRNRLARCRWRVSESNPELSS